MLMQVWISYVSTLMCTSWKKVELRLILKLMKEYSYKILLNCKLCLRAFATSCNITQTPAACTTNVGKFNFSRN